MARHFSNWLKAYVKHTSSSEAPDIFHFWTGVVTVAGALRRRVWKDELLFQWVPNFYVILVAPAGVATKSTSVNLGMRLLRQVDGVHFGPESMTWQALGKDFVDAQEYVDYIDDNGEIKSAAQSCLTISISELGTFLRPDDAQLVSFLTRMWDGQRETFQHHTKSAGKIEVDNPWLNVIGATTPAWMRNNFSEKLVGEGLTSRIVFVYAEEKRKYVAYPSKAVRPTDYHLNEKKLIDDLKEIAALSGPYNLTPDASKWGEDWYESHYKNPKPHLSSDRFAGYIARKQTHLHKLAIILAASQRDKLIIEKEDLEEAEQILTDTEKSMIKVFESIGLVDEAKHVAALKAFVAGYGFLPGDELRRLTQNTMNEKDFRSALRVACEGGILKVETQNGVRGLALVKRTIN